MSLVAAATNLAQSMRQWFTFLPATGQVQGGLRLWLKPLYFSRVGLLQPTKSLEGTLGIALTEINDLVTALDTAGINLGQLSTSVTNVDTLLSHAEIIHNQVQALKNNCQAILGTLGTEENKRRGRYHVHRTEDINTGVINLSRWPS
jgi:hypothetical protein